MFAISIFSLILLKPKVVADSDNFEHHVLDKVVRVLNRLLNAQTLKNKWFRTIKLEGRFKYSSSVNNVDLVDRSKGSYLDLVLHMNISDNFSASLKSIYFAIKAVGVDISRPSIILFDTPIS